MTEEHTFDHDQTIEAITSFYEWCDCLCNTVHKIEYPPPEGWPAIPLPKLAALGKNETVIKLLKHMPYAPITILRNTGPIKYHDDDRYNAPVIFYEKDDILADMKLPPHVFCYALGDGTDAYYVLMDTKKGVFIYDTWEPGLDPEFDFNKLSFKYLHPSTYTDEDFDEDDDRMWSKGIAITPQAFFELIKRKYLDLEWIPDGTDEGIYEVSVDDPRPEALAIQQAMKDCGWLEEDKTKFDQEKAEDLINRIQLPDHYEEQDRLQIEQLQIDDPHPPPVVDQ